MVRLADLDEGAQEHALALPCPSFDETPWADSKDLGRRHVCLISTAGLIQPGEPVFRRGDASYRAIPTTVLDNELTCSHISVNFDRTGLQRDMNVVLPRHRLAELADEGVIGVAAKTHYTFMGATDPVAMEPHARELAQTLTSAGVDSAVLAPV